jgi:hypothetical protein
MTKSTNIENIEISFIDSITSEKLAEIGSDTAELIFDSFLDNGVLKDIPIFGTLYKLGKAGIGIRDRYFMKKVLKFLFEIKNVTLEDRQKFIDDLEKSTAQKAGETLLILIDRIDNIEKTSILSNLLRSKVQEKISIEKFLRLAITTEKAFIADLKKLHLYVDNDRYDEDTSESLTSLGLVYMSIIDGGDVAMLESAKDSSDGNKYTISNLGREMLMYGLNNYA